MRGQDKRKRLDKSIAFYQGGVMLSGNGGIGNPSGKGGGKRGKISGWSSASRRRMRRFLLVNGVPPDMHVTAASFTVPGPVQPVAFIKALWTDWARRSERDGWAVVWRLEVQERGQLHWHCIVGVPRIPGHEFSEGKARGSVVQSWWDALRRAGPVVFATPVGYPGKSFTDADGTVNGIVLHGWPDLSMWPGAALHSVDAQVDQGDLGSWRRYMLDHATKAKQEQIAVGFGRHWGVVGRKRFVRVLPESIENVPDAVFWPFLRAYQRLCTPVLRLRPGRDKWRCPFGRHVGFRVRRGAWGQSVWYSKPEVVRRLVEWAKDQNHAVECNTRTEDRANED